MGAKDELTDREVPRAHLLWMFMEVSLSLSRPVPGSDDR